MKCEICNLKVGGAFGCYGHDKNFSLGPDSVVSFCWIDSGKLRFWSPVKDSNFESWGTEYQFCLNPYSDETDEFYLPEIFSHVVNYQRKYRDTLCTGALIKDKLDLIWKYGEGINEWRIVENAD